MPEPSGLTTDLVPEGTVNRYFTVARVQAAAATMFTGSVNSNVVFTYDAERRSLSANVAIPAPNPSGIMSVEQDPAPRLGGDLDLNGHAIIGFPIGIANLEQDTAPRLGGDLYLNNRSITGKGIVDISSEEEIPMRVIGITQGYSINPWVSINSARGTIENPTATLPGDSISGLMFRGYTGNNFYAFAGGIFSSWESCADLTVNTPDCPAANIQLVVGSGIDKNKLQFCTFNSQGVLSAPVIQVEPSDIYPANPLPGMIIFNNNDDHFYGWNGSTWQQLDN
jgi:hypothetical protein